MMGMATCQRRSPVLSECRPQKVITAAAAGIALSNAIGNLGGYVGPVMVGYVRDATDSYAYGLLLLSAFAFLSGFLVLLVGRRARK